MQPTPDQRSRTIRPGRFARVECDNQTMNTATTLFRELRATAHLRSLFTAKGIL
jgi:hypothetical protein